ncbi:uncharacterized protein At2g27730, mitochondrial [Impatiens glandulifera]|uniref:uncharacterized protein At2g27730, mitochondrial n=1 Tax=Impatiens glandulifera TaxID=253017 RepID=UPI001FB0C3E6|nr:uncharacterized protein At2g27730, mitochondrial [Impatiens glandulifera]
MATTTLVLRTQIRHLMETARGLSSGLRYFSDGKGKVLSEEERAAENIYIKKMEKERLKKKAEKEKAEKEHGEKKDEGDAHKK